jgi:lipopolysaccharide/colanic/teichoic acid biosynthesis glycosyltransferase
MTGATGVARCQDVFVSLFLVIVLAIWLNSECSISFGHLLCRRVGKAFRALRCRTMVADSDRILRAHFMRRPE